MRSVKYVLGLTTCEAFAKKTCKNRGRGKRFLVTSKLLMSLRVKHASSCGGFRCFLSLLPPFILNFAPILPPLCHLPVTVLSLCCLSAYSPRSYTLLIFSRGWGCLLCWNRTDVFIYFTSSSGNFKDSRKKFKYCKKKIYYLWIGKYT